MKFTKKMVCVTGRVGQETIEENRKVMAESTGHGLFIYNFSSLPNILSDAMRMLSLYYQLF